MDVIKRRVATAKAIGSEPTLCHSVTISVRKRAARQLQFERRSPRRVEPLIGWTEDDDPLAQVVLPFPSAESAIAYARRQGLLRSSDIRLKHPMLAGAVWNHFTSAFVLLGTAGIRLLYLRRF